MATATLINVPDAILRKYGTQIDFSLVRILPTKEKEKTPVSAQTFRERMDDPENTSYGPFMSMSEALIFLNRDLG